MHCKIGFSRFSLVIKAISGLEAERSCYRMVGGVLVERSVGEVLPVLTTNRDNVWTFSTSSHVQANTLIRNLENLLKEKNQGMADFAKKHGLVGQQPQDKEGSQPEVKTEKSGTSGVLV